MSKTYAYVDGGYLRERASVAIKKLFEREPEFCFDSIREYLHADRLFYCDCVEEPKEHENPNDFDIRTQAQTKLISSASHANFCHVKLAN